MMAKMNFYVCENYFPEFNSICEKEGFTDVQVIAFPSMCVDKSKKAETSKLLAEKTADGREGMVLCSKNCELCALIPPGAAVEVHLMNDCFGHLASESFINYILAKGGYIIGSGWLKSWRKRIKEAGFDQDTARRFYHEFCRELVFFDAGTDVDANKNLIELSKFLDLPYVVVPIQLESMSLMVQNMVSECRLHAKGAQSSQAIAAMEAQCAEYAAIFDLMGKIAAYSNKRDAIEKVKEIFLFVFGAQQFKYWNNDCESDDLPEEIKKFLSEKDKDVLFFKEENRFCIKIKWQEKLFGAIDVSGFMFPQYIEKYLNFAMEIVKICGLVFSNNEQYEKILKSEQEQRYSSTHDVLTGLYNRTYINQIIDQQTPARPFMVFMFDVDGLKFVNDHHGHAEGDKLIVNVADILKKCFRETDIVARIGGDEFVAILQETDIDAGKIFNDRIKHQIEMDNRNRQQDYLRVSFSIGYAAGEKSEDTIEGIMKEADERMYANKAEKRK